MLRPRIKPAIRNGYEPKFYRHFCAYFHPISSYIYIYVYIYQIENFFGKKKFWIKIKTGFVRSTTFFFWTAATGSFRTVMLYVHLFQPCYYFVSYNIYERETIFTALLEMTSHHAGFVLLQGSYGRIHDSSQDYPVSRLIIDKCCLLSLSLCSLRCTPQ